MQVIEFCDGVYCSQIWRLLLPGSQITAVFVLFRKDRWVLQSAVHTVEGTRYYQRDFPANTEETAVLRISLKSVEQISHYLQLHFGREREEQLTILPLRSSSAEYIQQQILAQRWATALTAVKVT